MCVCTCGWIRAWDRVFEGPGAGRAAEGALLWLKNLPPPWACSDHAGPTEVPGKLL